MNMQCHKLALGLACYYLGWQGGIVYDAKRELTKKEAELIRKHNDLEDHISSDAAESLRYEIALVQKILEGLIV